MRRCLSRFALFALLTCSFPCLWARMDPPITSATLDGTVLNSTTGEPIAEARVKVANMQDDEPLYTKTDAQGHFTFANLTTGLRYSIRAERPGFIEPGGSLNSYPGPAQFDLTPPGPGATERVSCGECETKMEKRVDEAGTLHVTLTMELVPYAAISGKVTAPNGMPLSGMIVDLLMKREAGNSSTRGPRLPEVQSIGGRMTADDRGEFRIAPLAPGKYYLRVSGTLNDGQWEPSYRTTYYGGALGLDSAKPIVLAVGQQVRADLQVVSRSGVRVSGRILLPAENEPAPGRRIFTNVSLVSLVAGGDGMADRNITNLQAPSQEYEMKDVLPGKYKLVATTYERPESPGFGGDFKVLYSGARTLEVGGRDAAGVELTMEQPEDIRGTVAFAEGCPRVPVRIDISGGGMRPPAPITVDGEDGKFILTKVAAGRVWLNIYTTGVNAGAAWPLSMRVGEQEVPIYQFDAPLPSGTSLKITMGCQTQRGNLQ